MVKYVEGQFEEDYIETLGVNFMEKSIAEQTGIHMPSFFGYILRYSVPILIPIFVVIWLIFFVL